MSEGLSCRKRKGLWRRVRERGMEPNTEVTCLGQKYGLHVSLLLRLLCPISLSLSAHPLLFSHSPVHPPSLPSRFYTLFLLPRRPCHDPSVPFHSLFRLQTTELGLMDADYEDKYVLKYGALEQDYEELQAEAEEVTRQLQKAKEAKRRLQAEVKFLKKRTIMLEEYTRRSERIHEPYFLRDAVGEASHYVFAPARVSVGRMLSADGEYHVPTSKAQFSKPLVRGPPGTLPSSKNRDVVGVLKTSTSKHAPNGFAPTKKAGKRKISWKDDFSVKA